VSFVLKMNFIVYFTCGRIPAGVKNMTTSNSNRETSDWRSITGIAALSAALSGVSQRMQFTDESCFEDRCELLPSGD